MCISYVKVLHFLHNSPIGVLMMCDSNGVKKIFLQFLLADDLTLVLNDVDRVPIVDPQNGTICNIFNKHLRGTLNAPEQIWPYTDIEK